MMQDRDWLAEFVRRNEASVEALPLGIPLRGKIPDEAAIKHLGSGRTLMANAVSMARLALDVDDPERHRLAREVCERLRDDAMPLAIQDGRRAAAEAGKAQQAEAAIRRRGGKQRADQQIGVAETTWEPWINRFCRLLETGKRPGTARRIVKGEMARAGVVLPNTGKFPSDRTLAAWLKIV